MSRLKLYLVCIILVLVLGKPALAANNTTAVIHGTAHKAGTFEPLNTVTIYINSTPPQCIVANDGKYSFELLPGNYTLNATYYEGGIPTYSTEETLQIVDDVDKVDYVYDLVLSPVHKFDLEKPPLNGEGSSTEDHLLTVLKLTNYLLIALIFIILLAAGYTVMRKRTGTEKSTSQGMKNEHINSNFETTIAHPLISKEFVEEPFSDPEIDSSGLNKILPLPLDLQDAINVIRAHGGRITQKDLRSKLKHSEVKVSLMLSDLEKRGLIEKFKSGRENIVILRDTEDEEES